MIKSFLSVFYVIFSIFTILVICSIDIPPSFHWVFVIIPLFIPVCLFINFLFLTGFFTTKNFPLLALSIGILLFGWKFYGRTFQFGNTSTTNPKSVKILSYNVRVFNNYSHLSENGKAAKKIIDFSKDNEADIKCFQEFYHTSVNKEQGLYNTVKKLRQKTPYYYLKPSAIILNQYFGLAIFSKYPIISKGEVKFPISTSNQAIFADIVTGRDTLRVYNVHLQSMSINEAQLPSTKYSSENKSRGKEILRKIIRGGELRTGQIKALLESISKSPYQVIICGDLNDTPYSFTYEELRENFNNAFEEKGRGFGFTYNGKLNILRIDNIFTDKTLKVLSFNVLRKIKYSDHFPIEVQITSNRN